MMEHCTQGICIINTTAQRVCKTCHFLQIKGTTGRFADWSEMSLWKKCISLNMNPRGLRMTTNLLLKDTTTSCTSRRVITAVASLATFLGCFSCRQLLTNWCLEYILVHAPWTIWHFCWCNPVKRTGLVLDIVSDSGQSVHKCRQLYWPKACYYAPSKLSANLLLIWGWRVAVLLNSNKHAQANNLNSAAATFNHIFQCHQIIHSIWWWGITGQHGSRPLSSCPSFPGRKLTVRCHLFCRHQKKKKKNTWLVGWMFAEQSS